MEFLLSLIVRDLLGFCGVGEICLGEAGALMEYN